jgi:hypothetical protein
MPGHDLIQLVCFLLTSFPVCPFPYSHLLMCLSRENERQRHPFNLQQIRSCLFACLITGDLFDFYSPFFLKGASAFLNMEQYKKFMQKRLNYISDCHNGNDRRGRMEGLYFYWLAWIAWIWVTFFMDKKKPERIKIAVWLLAAILAAPIKLSLLYFEFHLSALAIALFVFLETWSKKKGSLYFFLSSFIIMLAYTSFLMFELYDPIWVLFDRSIMLAAIGFYLALLLHKNRHSRILSLLAGFLQGEVLFSVILWKFKFPYAISSLAFMDILILSLAMLGTWSAVETILVTLSGSTTNQVEGEEQKTT